MWLLRRYTSKSALIAAVAVGVLGFTGAALAANAVRGAAYSGQLSAPRILPRQLQGVC